jgi:hypothetical protein
MLQVSCLSIPLDQVIMFWSSAFQVSALENRLVSCELELMHLQHQIKEKEADLVSLKQDVSTAY